MKKTFLAKLIGGLIFFVGIWIFLTGLLILVAQNYLFGYINFINELGFLPGLSFIFSLDPKLYVIIGLLALISGYFLKKVWTPVYYFYWMIWIGGLGWGVYYQYWDQAVVFGCLVIYWWWAHSDANEEFCSLKPKEMEAGLGKKIACFGDIK